MRSVSPPATAVIGLTSGSLAIVRRPIARRMTSGNSISVCAMAKARPPFAPDLVPWVIVAKNRGPGARTPDAVTRTTVTMRLSRSMGLKG